MRRDRRPNFRNALAPMLAVLALAGCGNKATREWQASDHDQEPTGGGAAPGSAGGGNDMVAIIEATWQSKCQKCHGAAGHGDGPSGPAVNAADLSDPKLQDLFTDDQLATIIAKGKNRMPAFSDLPPEIIGGLVAKVRSFRAQ
jgi:cytochrome c oxidase cbb3-type subunit 3